MFEEEEQDEQTQEEVASGSSGEAVEASEPAEAIDTAADEPAETAEPIGELGVVDEIVEQVFDWNGEVDSLKAAEWLSRLDGPTKDAVMRGIENKYRNFERGYTDAYQKNASRRKVLDRREQDVRDQEIRVQKWLHGDIDPMAEKQKEIESLKQGHQAAVQALRDEYDNALQDLSKSSRGDYDTITDKLRAAEQRVVEYERREAEIEKAQTEAAIDEFQDWLQRDAPHIAETPAAFEALCILCAGGVHPAEALDMTLSKYPGPQKAKPEPVPESVDLMNLGTGAASGTETREVRGFDEIFDQMRRVAQADAETNFSGG